MTTNFNHILNENIDMFDMETAKQIAESIKEDVMISNYTVESLAVILEANNWKATEVTCPDGAVVTVTPCFYGMTCKGIEDCDYFLVDGDIPWMGDDRIERVVEDINEHARLVADIEDERKELRKYFEGGQADGWTQHDWSWYSDWHKDLYGYRPHGRVCGEYVRPW